MFGPVLAFSDPVTGSAIPEADFPLITARRVTDRGTHMMETHHKRAEDTLDWSIDLIAWLEPGEEVTSVTGQAGPTDLVVQRVEFSPTGLVLWLAGGADGVRHEVHATVQTSFGKVKLFRFILITRGQSVSSEVELVISIDSITIRIDPVEDGGTTPPDPGTPEPVAAISPLSVTFASTQVGAGRDLVVTIINSGTAPLTITGATATGDFTVTGSALV